MKYAYMGQKAVFSSGERIFVHIPLLCIYCMMHITGAHCRWLGFCDTLREHAFHLSEVYREALRRLYQARHDLLKGPLNFNFIARRGANFSRAITVRR